MVSSQLPKRLTPSHQATSSYLYRIKATKKQVLVSNHVSRIVTQAYKSIESKSNFNSNSLGSCYPRVVCIILRAACSTLSPAIIKIASISHFQTIVHQSIQSIAHIRLSNHIINYRIISIQFDHQVNSQINQSLIIEHIL